MKMNYQIPACAQCCGIICTCSPDIGQHPKRFITVREWLNFHGVSLDELEEAESALASIKRQLITLDSEYEKDFGE